MSGSSSGLIFNNGMDDFSYQNRAVNYFGLQETPTNYPEPGKRALSSISPLIVIDKNSETAKLVIGAAGGSKIVSALSLALIRLSYCTKNIKQIVDAPRFHHQLVPNEIEYEYGVVNGVIEGLEEKGHKLKRYKNRGTIANGLMCGEKEIYGIADYRKDWSGVAGY
jgi:gamma-glutamyltranspeptidase / glutathione hydrolase / leukotriene-C4 hydrolase